MNDRVMRAMFLSTPLLMLFLFTSSAAKDFYQDAKGLFSFVPPRGWVEKSFVDSRSKVEFYDPSNPGNSVRIIAGAVEKSTIAEFKNRKSRLERAFRGSTVTVEDASVSGLPAVKFVVQHQWYQHIYMFWASGYEYSISLSGTDRDKFQKLATSFRTVLESFQIGQGRTPSDADRKRAQCASWLRLVDLCREAKSLEAASYYQRLAKEAGCTGEH